MIVSPKCVFTSCCFTLSRLHRLIMSKVLNVLPSYQWPLATGQLPGRKSQKRWPGSFLKIQNMKQHKFRCLMNLNDILKVFSWFTFQSCTSMKKHKYLRDVKKFNSNLIKFFQHVSDFFVTHSSVLPDLKGAWYSQAGYNSKVPAVTRSSCTKPHPKRRRSASGTSAMPAGVRGSWRCTYRHILGEGMHV